MFLFRFQESLQIKDKKYIMSSSIKQQLSNRTAQIINHISPKESCGHASLRPLLSALRPFILYSEKATGYLRWMKRL